MEDEHTAVDWAAAMADLAVALQSAEELDAIADAAMHHAHVLFGASRSGVYLLDPLTGRPTFSRHRGVTDFFLARYERVGRDRDPLLAHVLHHGTPVDNQTLMPIQAWRSLDVYRQVFHLHHLDRLLEIPLLAGDEVIGTMNLERSAQQPDDRQRDLVTASLAGRMIGSAMRTLTARRAAEQQRQHLLAALDLVDEGVVVTDLAAGSRVLNAAARDILSRIAGRGDTIDDLLGHAAEVQGVARMEVELRDGSTAFIEVSRTSVDEGAVSVSRLRLHDSVPTLGRHLQSLLTPRELEVVGLVSAGMRDSEVAARLSMSVHTVKDHLKHVYRKLGISSRVELAGLLLDRRTPPSDEGGVDST